MAAAQVISPLEALSSGRDLLSKHWMTVLKLFGVMLAVQFALTIASEMFKDVMILSTIVSFAGAVINLYFGYGFIKAMFGLLDGKNVEVRDLAQPAEEAVRYVVGTFAFSIAVGIGMMFLVIPGLYILTKYFFVPTLLVDTQLSIGDAFTASSKMTEGRQLDLLLFLVLSAVGVLLGLIAFIVGAFVVSWMVMFAVLVLHRSLVAKAS